ncbi:unnamed protein product [Rodentolepis nana]|uniref:Ovule protein n=1 Tax=Rodentolepis nana TaxID=102285 RepID=A0A0R3T7V8_RODNA|nr:unnamed protein product [Rodentolepis nana]
MDDEANGNKAYLDPNFDSNNGKEEYSNITRVPPSPPGRCESMVDPLQLFGGFGDVRRSDSPIFPEFYPPRPDSSQRLDGANSDRDTNLQEPETAVPIQWESSIMKQINALNYKPINIWPQGNMQCYTAPSNQNINIESAQMYSNVFEMDRRGTGASTSFCYQNQFQPHGWTYPRMPVNHSQLPQAPSYGNSGFIQRTPNLEYSGAIPFIHSTDNISGGPQPSTFYWNRISYENHWKNSQGQNQPPYYPNP